MTLVEELKNKLNTLIIFLSFAHDESIELVLKNRLTWFSETEEKIIPNTKEVFKTQIANSAFLLGYTYFESFLYDLIREIYRRHPKMLPDNKKIEYSNITRANELSEVLDRMIDREIHEAMYQSMEDIIKYLRTKFSITINDRTKAEMIKCSFTRNCIMHNNSKVDEKLSSISGYSIHKDINLTSVEVNSYGIILRNLSEDLYNQATCKYFNRKGNGVRLQDTK